MKDTSPFPGMDPYLEDPAEWSTVHTLLISAIGEQLVQQVRPHYSVKIEQRVYILTPDEQRDYAIVPDVVMIQRQALAATMSRAAGITQPTLVEPLVNIEIRERYIEILDRRRRRVVTTLELLSPFNKRPGTSGREAFLQKRQAVFSSDVHWIEIDLLRGGERPAEVAGLSHYYALLKRGSIPRPYEVWYIDLHERLPVIAVPLTAPQEDVPLDLQAAFTTVYQRADYATEIDYDVEVPSPRLSSEEIAWVREQVQAWR
jgi:hypothetical protein